MSTSALWSYMVKGLGRGTYGLSLGLEGPGLGIGLSLEILALTTSLICTEHYLYLLVFALCANFYRATGYRKCTYVPGMSCLY